jgi:uncharacterized membrane protein YidH (DUF202 family)
MKNKQSISRIIGIIIIIISILFLIFGIVIFNSDISFLQKVAQAFPLMILSVPLAFFGGILTVRTRKQKEMFLLTVGLSGIATSPLFLSFVHSLNLLYLYILISILLIILGIIMLYNEKKRSEKKKINNNLISLT